MKLIVMDANGTERLVEIELPIQQAVEGERLNQIIDANGVEHYFTKDGHYDGWGNLLA